MEDKYYIEINSMNEWRDALKILLRKGYVYGSRYRFTDINKLIPNYGSQYKHHQQRTFIAVGLVKECKRVIFETKLPFEFVPFIPYVTFKMLNEQS